jgi:AcrR family transcriptional regulator
MDATVHLAKVRGMTGTLPHVLRSDAQDNRDRVLEAARELFAESGLGVTMRQIARRAGVGPATLYRRFPTKQDLVLEAFMGELGACSAIVREAAADPDPWRGFCSVIERVTVLNARNQGFTDAFLAEYPSVVDFTAHRAALTREIAAISRRAIAAGELRADFVVDDFMLVLLAGRGLTAVPARYRVAAARRFAALAIEGLRTGDANHPLPKSPRLASSVISAGPLSSTADGGKTPPQCPRSRPA